MPTVSVEGDELNEDSGPCEEDMEAGGIPGPDGRIGAMPRKRFFRARAHSNPLTDHQFPVPVTPREVDWSQHYPSFFPPKPEDAGKAQPAVEFADVGCGFGGLLVKLSPLFPTKLMVGFEIRDKVAEYVKERILGLRRNHPGQYGNISCIRTNAMKFLPNYFRKGQLTKMFFLFPDPHFKAANHRRRIISRELLTEYAYLLASGGIVYTITDVKELADWMRAKLEEHPLFEPLSREEMEADVCTAQLYSATEEGQKVERNSGEKHVAIFRRI
eukprot:jgi/Mesvir1/847/Mv17420-RA.1